MKIAACLLAAVAACFAAPPEDSCYIEGRVVNAATGEPVRNARLTLTRQDNPAGGTAMPVGYFTASDGRGQFAMKDIGPGKYKFTAERAGFAEMEYGARRPGRPGATLSLDAGQRLTGVIFRLTPHAVIAGRILDEDGDPVEGAQVQAMRYRYASGKRELAPAGFASTDDLGEYRLFGLAPGRYFVTATPGRSRSPMETVRGKAAEQEYVTTYYPGTVDPSSALTLDLAPGALARGIDFLLSRAHTVRVRGRVSYPAGWTPQNTMLTFAPRGRWAWYLVRRARIMDPGGSFEFGGIPPGVYHLTVVSWSGKERYSARRQVDVASADIDNLVVTLSTGAELAGQLRFEGPPPANLSDIQVTLRERDGGGMMFGPTPSAPMKEDGSFTLSNVGMDIYKAEVIGLPDGYFLKSVRMGDDEVKDTGIDTTRGVAGPLVITISAKAGQIEGVVLDANQRPTAGVPVVLVPEPKLRDRAEAWRDATTDQYGRFVLKNLEPGAYKLFAWEDLEPGEYMDPEFLKPVEERGYAVQIREGSRESAELKLIPAEQPAPKTGK
jgi:5-hydroxyisourate hydrolase-like protein (transthyretin family)